MSLTDFLKNNVSVNRRQLLCAGAVLLAPFGVLPLRRADALKKKRKKDDPEEPVKLKNPLFNGSVSIEDAIKNRRTTRFFMDKPISAQQFSQLLWAAQGITEDSGSKRSAPSAGALYPVDVYISIGENSVDGMVEGVYQYRPEDHSIVKIVEGDRRKDLASASLGQMWMAGAALLIILTVEYGRITCKYGDRGIRYAHIETGHIGQNVFLQSQGLGLETGIVGAFNDQKVAELLGTKEARKPLIILPVGWPG